MAEVSSRKVLLAALLVPGSGHVWLGKASRGFMFLFFIVVFGWLSHKLMPATASIVGRNIGGIFVYGMSVIDAYRTAKLKELKK